jgi:WD40 repeat protein
LKDLGNITVTEHCLDFYVNRNVFDPSGNTCAAWTTQKVKILSADSLKETTSVPYDNVEAMQFTPNDKHILLVELVLRSETLVLWDIAASAIVQQLTIDLSLSRYWYAQISNDCRFVVISDRPITSHIIHLLH